MKTASDAIIVGGGPSGSFTALKLAERGANVTVFEEHDEIGIPSHCAGHLSIKGLKQLKLHLLPTEIVENTFHGATFHAPSGNEFSVHFSSPITCTVNRALFDRYIAKKAENVGAEYCLNSRVESLVIEDGLVKGVAVKQEGKTRRKLAKIVIDAEGISSRLSREAGLRGPDPNKLVNGVEAEVENVENIEPDTVEVYLGNDYAPGFYAWLIPKKDEKAKVGLATKTGNPKNLLQKLMLEHPAARKKLHNARILQTIFHPITLGGLTPQAYANGFLTVGDAASQVKPTTGGGVLFGMTCAQIAAKVAYEDINRNDLSSKFLARYQKECREALGFDVKIMLRMRKTLNAMSDRTIDSMIGMCTKLGLDKTLQNVEDIDFQGQSLLRVLRSPRMLTALGYFFFTYLSANL
jgi:geranylgeranyl reductase family protein